MGEGKLLSLDLKQRARAQKREAEQLVREAQRVGNSTASGGVVSLPGTSDPSIAELIHEALHALRVFNANPAPLEHALRAVLRPSELRDIARLLDRWASEREALARAETVSAVRAASVAARLEADEDACEILARHDLVGVLHTLRTMMDARLGRDARATLRVSTSDANQVSVHVEGRVTEAKIKRLARLADDWVDAPDDAWKIISIYPT